MTHLINVANHIIMHIQGSKTNCLIEMLPICFVEMSKSMIKSFGFMSKVFIISFFTCIGQAIGYFYVQNFTFMIKDFSYLILFYFILNFIKGGKLMQKESALSKLHQFFFFFNCLSTCQWLQSMISNELTLIEYTVPSISFTRTDTKSEFL